MIYPPLAKLAKTLIYASPLKRHFLPRYNYQFTPAQLSALCGFIDQAKSVPGCIVEIGCSTGESTIFLNKHMQLSGIDKSYIAIDTFGGFVDEDIEAEVQRGKRKGLFNGFRANSRQWFDAGLRQNGIANVTSIQADINKFDIGSLGPIAFALLDVDLYRPIKGALPRLLDAMSPGGIIVVDDCDSTHAVWDGAAQAYVEFMDAMQLPKEIILGKLGIITSDSRTQRR